MLLFRLVSANPADYNSVNFNSGSRGTACNREMFFAVQTRQKAANIPNAIRTRKRREVSVHLIAYIYSTVPSGQAVARRT